MGACSSDDAMACSGAFGCEVVGVRHPCDASSQRGQGKPVAGSAAAVDCRGDAGRVGPGHCED